MLGSSFTTLKEVITVEGHTLKLSKSIKHGYGFTAKGRGTIKTKISYEVWVQFHDMRDELMETLLYTTKKADAEKIFKIAARVGYEEYKRAESMAAELVDEMNEEHTKALLKAKRHG